MPESWITVKLVQAITLATIQHTNTDYAVSETGFSQPTPGDQLNRRDSSSSLLTTSSIYTNQPFVCGWYEPSYKYAEVEGSNANEASHELDSNKFIAKLSGPDATAHEVDSRGFVAELPAPDYPTDTKPVYEK